MTTPEKLLSFRIFANGHGFSGDIKGLAPRFLMTNKPQPEKLNFLVADGRVIGRDLHQKENIKPTQLDLLLWILGGVTPLVSRNHQYGGRTPVINLHQFGLEI